jgi:hypothetical protein
VPDRGLRREIVNIVKFTAPVPAPPTLSFIDFHAAAGVALGRIVG